MYLPVSVRLSVCLSVSVTLLVGCQEGHSNCQNSCNISQKFCTRTSEARNPSGSWLTQVYLGNSHETEMSVCSSVCLSVCLSVCQFAELPVHLSALMLVHMVIVSIKPMKMPYFVMKHRV